MALPVQPYRTAPIDYKNQSPLTDAIFRGMQQAQQFQTNQLAQRQSLMANQKTQEESPYWAKNAMEESLKGHLMNEYQKQVNQYYAPNIQSEMKYRNAGTGHLNEETATARYKREKGLLDTNEIQNIRYVMDMVNKQKQEKQFADQQQLPPVNLPSAQLNMPNRPSNVESSIQQYLQQNQQQQAQPQLANIPDMPVEQSQQQQQTMLPGTNIPSSGNEMADRLLMKMIGVTPESVGLAEYRNTQQKVMESNLKAANFDKMPAAQKSYAINQAMGFGLSNSAATARLRNGDTVEDIARSRGFDADKPETWPLPKAPPTSTMMTQQQRANVARSAFNAIEPVVASALKPYSQKLPNGYSLSQVVDAVKGQNEEQQGKAIAAAYISTEMNALAARSGGIQNIGIGLLRDMLGKSKQTLKTMDITMSPKVFEASQKYIKEYGNIINRAENKAMWAQQQSEFDNEDKISDQQSDHGDIAGMTDEQIKAELGMS